MFKKNKLFMLTVMFAFMFVGVNSVSAAEELTCVYSNSNITYILTQNKDGLQNVYSYLGKKVDNDEKFKNLIENNISPKNVLGIYYSDGKINKLSSAEKKQYSKKNLDTCPKYFNLTSLPRSDAEDAYGDVSSYKDFMVVYLYEVNSGWEWWNNTFQGQISLTLSYDYNVFSGVEDETAGKIDSDNAELVDENNIGKGKKCSEMGLDDYWLVEFDENLWSNTCLYAYQDGDNCNIYQLNLNDNMVNDYFSLAYYEDRSVSFGIGTSAKDLNAAFNGYCPINIYMCITSPANATSPVTIYKTSLTKCTGYTTDTYSLYNSRNVDDYKSLIINPVIEINDCGDLLSDEMVDLLSTAVNYSRVLVPIILLVLGIVDFATAVFGSKEEDMNKCVSKFVKRVIICFAIFLVPSLLELLLTIAHSIWSDISPDLCGIL